MAIKKTQQGFALLIAIIFMSVMMTLGLTLGSIAYKQQMLASVAVESQYAFYAADAALECALYADQRQNLFALPVGFPGSAPLIVCDGNSATYTAAYPNGIVSDNPGIKWNITERLSLDLNTRCADITIYKPAPNTGTTYIFAQGYDVSCAALTNPNARFVARGLQAHY